MTEWTVHVETYHGATASVPLDAADALDRFDEALHAQPSALGPCASVNTRTASLSATFAVKAETIGGAADTGADAFNAALAEVGIDPGTKIRVDVEPSEARELVPA